MHFYGKCLPKPGPNQVKTTLRNHHIWEVFSDIKFWMHLGCLLAFFWLALAICWLPLAPSWLPFAIFWRPFDALLLTPRLYFLIFGLPGVIFYFIMLQLFKCIEWTVSIHGIHTWDTCMEYHTWNTCMEYIHGIHSIHT